MLNWVWASYVFIPWEWSKMGTSLHSIHSWVRNMDIFLENPKMSEMSWPRTAAVIYRNTGFDKWHPLATPDTFTLVKMIRHFGIINRNCAKMYPIIQIISSFLINCGFFYDFSRHWNKHSPTVSNLMIQVVS